MKQFKSLSICFLLLLLLILNKVISKLNLYIKKRYIKDVLFIFGYKSKTFPQLYKYRILHQKEQLKAGFLESDDYFTTYAISLLVGGFFFVALMYYDILVSFEFPCGSCTECAWVGNLSMETLSENKELVVVGRQQLVLPHRGKPILKEHFGL